MASNSTILIVVKAVDEDSNPKIDFSPDLLAGETLTSVSITSVLPATLPALSATLLPVPGFPVLRYLELSGGHSNSTYGIRLSVTTSTNRVFPVTVGVQIQDSPFSTLRTRNPHAFKPLIEEIEAGEVGIGKGVFMYPADADVSAATIFWELLDQDGAVYSSGNAFDYTVTRTSLSTRVEGTGLVNVPSDVPTSIIGNSFQVRWQMLGVGSEPAYSFENVRVRGNTTVPTGAQPIVELAGMPAALTLVLPNAYEEVEFEIYNQNNSILGSQSVALKDTVETGYYYSQILNTYGMAAMLDPYTVVWKYRNTTSPSFTADQAYDIEYGAMYLVNPTILRAVDQVQQTLQKARSSLLRFEDILFEPITVLNWLARGRDMFNGAGGRFTSFNMTNATGAIREFWLGYSEVAAARSHALAEGEKAFNFSGQAITLDRDVAQYYQAWADAKQSELDAAVNALKMNFLRKGLDGGDGDANGARGRTSMGLVGIAITPVSRNATSRRMLLIR